MAKKKEVEAVADSAELEAAKKELAQWQAYIKSQGVADGDPSIWDHTVKALEEKIEELS